MGATTVVCGVKAEIAEPELDREQEGFLGAFPSFFLLRWMLHTQFMYNSAELGSSGNVFAKVQTWSTFRRGSNSVR